MNGPRSVKACVTLSPSLSSLPTVAPVTIAPPRSTILAASARVNLAQSPVSSVGQRMAPAIFSPAWARPGSSAITWSRVSTLIAWPSDSNSFMCSTPLSSAFWSR